MRNSTFLLVRSITVMLLIFCAFGASAQKQNYGSGITFNVVSQNFLEAHKASSQYTTIAVIRFQNANDTTFISYGPSKAIIRPDLSLLYFEDHPLSANPRQNAAFDFRITPWGSFHYEWALAPGHKGTVRRSNLFMEILSDWTPVVGDEIRPHLGGGQYEYDDSLGLVFPTLEQTWDTARDFRPLVDYPYTVPGSEVIITETTEIEHVYHVYRDSTGALQYYIDLTDNVGYDVIDAAQYLPGEQVRVRLQHTNAYDAFKDIDGAVDSIPGEMINMYSMLGASDIQIRKRFPGTLVGWLVRDGYQLMGGEFDSTLLELSAQHSLIIPDPDVTDGIVRFYVFNNGGFNDPFGAQPVEIELRFGTHTNPDGKPFAYGIVCMTTDETKEVKQLGSYERFPDLGWDFVNWGRSNTDVKLEWFSCETGEVFATGSFDDPLRETFNAPVTASVYGMEDYAPTVRAEWVDGELSMIISGNGGPYRLPDGSTTNDSIVALMSTRADEIGACQPFGNQNGWICARNIDQDELDQVVAVRPNMVLPVHIGPNPMRAGNVVTAAFPDHLNITHAELISMNGQRTTVSIEFGRFVVPELTPGVYMFQAQAEGRYYQEKTIIF